MGLFDRNPNESAYVGGKNILRMSLRTQAPVTY